MPLSLSFGVCCRKLLRIEENLAAPLTVRGNALPSRIAQQRDRIARIDRCRMQTRFAHWSRAASLIRRNIVTLFIPRTSRNIPRETTRFIRGDLVETMRRFGSLILISPKNFPSSLHSLLPFFFLSSFFLFFFLLPTTEVSYRCTWISLIGLFVGRSTNRGKGNVERDGKTIERNAIMRRNPAIAGL